MIVKDVEMDEQGHKTYVFGLDERLAYLIEKIGIMNNAVNNEMPSEALLELRRTQQTIEGWRDEN
jgi:hypothetical protein